MKLASKIVQSKQPLNLLMTCMIFVSFNLMAQENNFNEMVDDLIEETVPTIDSKSLYKELKKNKHLVVLDAREPIEYAISHIEDAVYVGYQNFDTSKIENISKDSKIVVYCSLGYRSERIAEQMSSLGYNNVYNLYGGIFDWINKDYPIVSKEKKTRNIHPYDEEWGKWLKKGNKTYER